MEGAWRRQSGIFERHPLVPFVVAYLVGPLVVEAYLVEPLVVVVFLVLVAYHPSYLELMAFLVHPCCFGDPFFVVDHHCFDILYFVEVFSFCYLVVHRFVA